jgi:transcriptional regulator
MYIPELFEECDSEEVKRIINEHPLATLAYTTDSGVHAQHVPLIFAGENTLIGHVAAASPISSELHNNGSVLAIFVGQDSYISPNWYPTKAEHHRHVPTWNYQAVHVSGRITLSRDSKSALAVVGKLTKNFESKTNGNSGWKMADAPREYIESMLQEFVPFEITIDRIEAKSKLSQNREKVDFDSVQTQMETRGQTELAVRMQRLKS